MTVDIACCPEHGLHGQREDCHVCGGPVKQVPMVPAPTGDALERSVKLRVPRFDKQAGASALSEGLADYMLESAYVQGDLAEERVDRHRRLDELGEEWDALEGWEPFRQGKTDKSIDEAKRQLRPDLYSEMEGLRRRIRRLTEEFDRLEGDATKCSRVHKILTGQ